MTKPPQEIQPDGRNNNSSGRKPWGDAENELRAPRGRHNRGAPQILVAAMMIRRGGRDGGTRPFPTIVTTL